MANVRRIIQMQRDKVDDRGEVRHVVEVSFMVGDQGPFVVDVPLESYEPEIVQRMVQEYANRVATIKDSLENGG